VAVVTHPGEYADILRELSMNKGTLGLDTRFRLARAAFTRVARYDQAIMDYLAVADPAVGFASYTIRKGS
jgi:phosphoribosylaminoimidazolecarboxamide formyltransferase/IMP cyclohydrolase